MSKTPETSAASRIKLLRNRIGKSQEEMAAMLHISASGYRNYERGEREIPVVTLERARDHFGLNPDWVLKGTGEMFLETQKGGPEAGRIAKVFGLKAPPTAFDPDLMRAIMLAALVQAKFKDPERLTELCLVAYEMEQSAAEPDPEGRIRQLLRLAG